MPPLYPLWIWEGKGFCLAWLVWFGLVWLLRLWTLVQSANTVFLKASEYFWGYNKKNRDSSLRSLHMVWVGASRPEMGEGGKRSSEWPILVSAQAKGGTTARSQEKHPVYPCVHSSDSLAVPKTKTSQMPVRAPSSTAPSHCKPRGVTTPYLKGWWGGIWLAEKKHPYYQNNEHF